MTGQGSWWSAYSTCGSPECVAGAKVEDEDIIAKTSSMFNKMVSELVIVSILTMVFFLAMPSIKV